jgi:hypothetical protein
MKRRFYFLMLLAFSVFASCKENNNSEKSETSDKEASTPKTVVTPEEKAAIADDEVVKIDILKLKKIKKRYQNPDPEKYYDMAIYYAYYNNDELVKLEELVGEEGYLTNSQYYFKEGKVFYCFTESSYMDETYLHRKDYIENDKIYRILAKEKDPHDEDTDFNNLKEEVWGEKEVKNTSEGFKKGMDGTMDRFKAAEND